METKNKMTLFLSAMQVNEAFARNAVAAFCAMLDPTVDELSDIKTAVSEAVTNAIVHAYPENDGARSNKTIKIETVISDNIVHIAVSDDGVGIEDIQKAREPFYTTRPFEEHSGMGFTLMESFTDSLTVENNSPCGTVVKMSKAIRGADWKEKRSSSL